MTSGTTVPFLVRSVTVVPLVTRSQFHNVGGHIINYTQNPFADVAEKKGHIALAKLLC